MNHAVYCKANHAADVSNPGSYEEFVELLLPVLQERRIMWKDYAVLGGTFRENFRRKRGDKNLPPNYHAAQFRYDALKEKYTDENGDIVIDRKKEVVLADKDEWIKLATELDNDNLTHQISNFYCSVIEYFTCDAYICRRGNGPSLFIQTSCISNDHCAGIM